MEVQIWYLKSAALPKWNWEKKKNSEKKWNLYKVAAPVLSDPVTARLLTRLGADCLQNKIFLLSLVSEAKDEERHQRKGSMSQYYCTWQESHLEDWFDGRPGCWVASRHQGRTVPGSHKVILERTRSTRSRNIDKKMEDKTKNQSQNQIQILIQWTIRSSWSGEQKNIFSPGSLFSTGDSGSNEENSLLTQCRCSPLGVLVLRVSSVDDDVTLQFVSTVPSFLRGFLSPSPSGEPACRWRRRQQLRPWRGSWPALDASASPPSPPRSGLPPHLSPSPKTKKVKLFSFYTKVTLTSLFKKSSTLLVVLLYATTCKATMTAVYKKHSSPWSRGRSCWGWGSGPWRPTRWGRCQHLLPSSCTL